MLKLKPYQEQGVDFLLARRFALLALDMGLGKTAVAITALDRLQAQRVLVVCPGVARINWQREFQKWSSRIWEYNLVFNMTGAVPPNPKSTGRPYVSICSYETVTAYKGDMSCSSNPNRPYWDVIVLDECHYLKSTEANRTRKIMGSEGLVHNTRRVWAISGTPAPNHPGELWVMMYAFGVTKLSYIDFLDRYCETYPYNGKLVVKGAFMPALPELKAQLNTFMIRRKKEDVLPELPQITYEDVFVKAGFVDLEIQWVQYFSPRDTSHLLFEKIKKEENLVKSVTRQMSYTADGMRALEAMANSVATLRRYTGLQKLEPIGDIIENELKAGAYSKIVIFAIHQGVIDGLRLRLQKYHPVTLYGKTPAAKRQMNIDLFNNVPKYRVFIGNIGACGVAIDLTAASQIIMAEQEWTPALNAQAVMRCHRINQKKRVTVRCVHLANSFEEKLGSVLRRKTKQLTALFDDNPYPAQKISN